MTAATTITNAVVKIGENAGQNLTGAPTLEDIENEPNMRRLAVMIYALELQAVTIDVGTSGDSRRQAVDYLRERIGDRGRRLLRDAFSIPIGAELEPNAEEPNGAHRTPK